MFWNMPIMFCRCSGDMFCIIFIAAAGSMVAGCCRSPCPAATTWVKVALVRFTFVPPQTWTPEPRVYNVACSAWGWGCLRCSPESVLALRRPSRGCAGDRAGHSTK